jgi:hypothetical protein
MGFIAGVSAYRASRWLRARAEAAESEDEDETAGPKVEWVLRGRRQRWRDRALVRVSPVLLASLWAFAGATTFAPSDLSLGLLAVGVLGLSATLVLYSQECRLRDLERRFKQGRES